MENQQENERHIFNLISIIYADGKITVEEINLLNEIGQKYHYSPAQINQMIKDYNKHTPKISEKITDRFKKLYELLQMIMVDGEASPSEIKVLRIIAQKMGFRPELIETLINNIHTLVARGFDKNLLTSFNQNL